MRWSVVIFGAVLFLCTAFVQSGTVSRSQPEPPETNIIEGSTLTGTWKDHNLGRFKTRDVDAYLVTSQDHEHFPYRKNLEKRLKQLVTVGKPLNYTPVILWHGMGDSAHGSVNIDRLALERRFPGITVFSVQIGNSIAEDVLAGYFVNVNFQIQQVCKEVLKNQIIRDHGAVNVIGFSQGAQFMRGLIERCPLGENGIRVKNFISLGGQHQGVFGLPRCKNSIFCSHIRELLTTAAYHQDVQEHLVQAEYWHDPHQESVYSSKSLFLADINNENTINETYRRNLLSLDTMVLVEFTEDGMVVPRESSNFGFYAENDLNTIVPLEQSRIYLEDRLGLKQLNQEKRLKLIKVPGDHLQYSMSWFLNEIASNYLDN